MTFFENSRGCTCGILWGFVCQSLLNVLDHGRAHLEVVINIIIDIICNSLPPRRQWRLWRMGLPS